MRRASTVVAVAIAGVLACTAACARQEPRREEVLRVTPSEPEAPPEARIALANPGFESTAPPVAGAPAGWLAAQHAGEISYAFRVDDVGPRAGRYSARIDNTGPQPFGILYQMLPGTPYIGKRLRFSAEVRTRQAGTEDSFSGAVLVLQAMQAGVPLAVERMADRALRGDHGWARHSVELVIPPGTHQVQVGIMLMGNGTAWTDDAALVSVP